MMALQKSQYVTLETLTNFYGLDREITEIKVTNTTATPNVTYTLSCNPAVQIGLKEADANSFFVIVPDGTYSFKIEIAANVLNITPRPDYLTHGKGIDITNRYFSTTSDKIFSKGVINNMPARCITTIWAPVNCGYDASNYKYGKLYQWGRLDGQGYKDGSYEDASYPSGSDLVNGQVSSLGNLVASTFYYGNLNWYSGSNPNPDDLWEEDQRSLYDPCPGGWKTPTKAQLNSLTDLGTKSWVINRKVDGSETGTYNGYLFDNKLFLPAAGGRYYLNAQVSGRNTNGYYWSSSVDVSTKAWAWTINSTDTPYSYPDGRGGACSVRCVLDENAVHTGATLPGDMPNVSTSW